MAIIWLYTRYSTLNRVLLNSALFHLIWNILPPVFASQIEQSVKENFSYGINNTYCTSHCGIWWVISWVMRLYFHKPQASENTAYEHTSDWLSIQHTSDWLSTIAHAQLVQKITKRRIWEIVWWLVYGKILQRKYQAGYNNISFKNRTTWNNNRVSICGLLNTC